MTDTFSSLIKSHAITQDNLVLKIRKFVDLSGVPGDV